MSSLALLLLDVLELLLALPTDDADFGRSSNEEISTLAAVAGLLASSRDGNECRQRSRCRSRMDVSGGSSTNVSRTGHDAATVRSGLFDKWRSRRTSQHQPRSRRGPWSVGTGWNDAEE